MSVTYLHGIETAEISVGTSVISEVRSAVIGLVGTAPSGPVNTPILVRTASEAAAFGSFSQYGLTSGYSIPAALSMIQQYGSGAVIVINVFDPQKVKPKADPEDEDEYYTVAETTAADIVGETAVDGTKTGIAAFKDCFDLFGFVPKILLAPGYSDQSVVNTALLTVAAKLRAIALVDLSAGMTVAQAIASRGSGGTFNVTSDRAYLLYPRLKVYDLQTEQDQVCPYSSAMAGLIAQTDRDYGYWYSPSNRPLIGITGLERTVTSSYTDAESDSNLLNEKGITTIINGYGAGYRSYGNRLANFPGISGIKTFIAARRVGDIIADSLEQSMAQYIDVPLSAAIVEDITQVGNAFLRTLQARGAIIGGVCYPSAEDNTSDALSNGHLTMIYEYTPPAALERITNKLVLTTAYYNA